MKEEMKRLKTENEQLKHENTRLLNLLGHALAHTSDSYRDPIVAILKRNARKINPSSGEKENLTLDAEASKECSV